MIINGINARSEFGIVLADGAYKELWKLPVAKKGYEYNWNDKNGIETDPLEVPVYDRILYNVPLILSANGVSDYWNKFNAFTAFLFANRNLIIDIPKRSRRFKLLNLGITSYEDFADSSNPFCTINLNLANDYPTQIFPIE